MHAIDLELKSQLSQTEVMYAAMENLGGAAPYDKVHCCCWSGYTTQIPAAGTYIELNDMSSWDDIKLVMTSNICMRSLITGLDRAPGATDPVRRTADRSIEWKAQLVLILVLH